jgi:hypothetical protein
MIKGAPMTPKPSEPSRQPLRIPEGLDWQTAQLVIDFASAMAEKLFAAQKKYGYDTGWTEKGWFDECRRKLREHTEKGDPRDVANYCAFLWYHKQSTAAPAESTGTPALCPLSAQPNGGLTAEQVRLILNNVNSSSDFDKNVKNPQFIKDVTAALNLALSEPRT